jgi:anion-transporting  ArsA/GET3 family ATPase
VLAAPERLLRLLDNRVFRTLVAPARRGFRVVSAATQTLLKPIGSIVGADVLADAVAFFQAFEGMEEGFRQRARSVQALLRSDRTAWLVVTTGTSAAVAEAGALVEQLGEEQVASTTVVANRLTPSLGVTPPKGSSASDAALAAALRVQQRADAERAAIASLAPPGEIAEIDATPTPLHDIERLATLLRQGRR